MNINATFFIQIFNFCVFYWLMRAFLFKPTIKAIDCEYDEKEKLSTLIDQQKTSIEIKEKEHQRSWHISREYFKVQRPAVGDRGKKIDKISLASYDKKHFSFSTEEISTLAGHVYKRLEEKIKHVH